VVTVVTTSGAAVVHGDAGACVGTGTGAGAAVSHGLPIDRSRAVSGTVSQGLEGLGTGTGTGSGTTSEQGFPAVGAGVDAGTYGVVVTVVGM